MDEDIKAVLAIIAAVILIGLLVWGIVWVITYREEKEIVVDDRFWTYTRSIKYDVTTTYPHVSTRTWTDSKGNTHTETTTELKTRTDTYTRCTGNRLGRELPPLPPVEMPCVMAPGDYQRNSVKYQIAYHESEHVGESELATIPVSAWNEFEPNRVIIAQLTLWQHVAEFDVIQNMLLKFWK